MSELSEFVEARLAEAERTALAATGLVWSNYDSIIVTSVDDRTVILIDHRSFDGGGTDTVDTGDHIALHDPAQVLRDVATKRALLDWAARHGEDGGTVLRILASAYEDHPDYRRREWALDLRR